MDHTINIVIGLLVIAGIVFSIIKRPIAPKIGRWLIRHQSRLAPFAPFVFILWGGGIWAAMIFKNDYSNIGAMVAASILVCMGIFFFFFFKR